MPVRRVLAVAFLAFGIAVPFASADSVTINSGLAVVSGGVSGSGPISVSGTDGFAYSGFLGQDASFGPKICSPCAGGTSIPLAGIFTGGDLPISAISFEGVTYTDVNGPLSGSNVSALFSGTPLIAPPVTTDSVVLSGPVFLNGHFSLSKTENGPFITGDYSGHGTAFVSLVRDAGLPTTWDYAGARYVLTPEPGSLLLLGSGFCLLARFARKKRPA